MPGIQNVSHACNVPALAHKQACHATSVTYAGDVHIKFGKGACTVRRLLCLVWLLAVLLAACGPATPAPAAPAAGANTPAAPAARPEITVYLSPT